MSKSSNKDKVYEGIEAMVTMEITKLGELVEKRKNSKTKVSKDLYDKKIEKVRGSCLKYMFELYKLDPKKVEQLMGEAVLESELESGSETKEIK